MEAFRDKSPGSDVGEEDVALSGSLVFRNVGLNLIGQVTPLFAGVIAIPLLIDGIGTDAFGVLAIAWMFVGSFSLFDLGLSRALTQLVADRLGTGRKREVPALVWTTLALTLLIGLIGGAGLVPDLFKFGAWMTVSNLVSPLMVYMDRFLIGVVLTASAVAYYATPWEVVPKLPVIAGAMSAVLFPAFSYWSGNRIDQAKRFFRTGLKAVALTLFPLVLLVVAGAKPGLSWWLDSSFARESALPMQILAVGVLLNGAAGIPFALIQGLGRPDITARLHLIELPVYAALLWFLLREFGIVGAAIAWSFRVMLDFVLLAAMSHRLLSFSFNDVKILAATILAGVSAAGAVMLPTTAGLQIALAVLFGIAWIPAAWTFVITAQEKRFLQSLVAKVSS